MIETITLDRLRTMGLTAFVNEQARPSTWSA